LWLINNMKLYYIANIGLPSDWAHSVQIMKMCEAFAENGADVTLIARHGSGEDPFAFYNVRPIFKIVKMPAISLSKTSPSRAVFAVRLFSFLISARIYLWFKKFDVIYTREVNAGRFFKNTFLETHTFSQKIKEFNFAGIIALTSFIKEKIVSLGVNPEKVLVAGDAVRLEDFEKEILKEQARKILNLPDDKKIIGYMGTLKTMGKEKGIGVALDAIKELNDEYLLYIVGGEPEDIEFYKHQVSTLGVDTKCLFTGKVPHTDIPLHMAACDILIAPFPDIEHYRHFMSPLKIFEYMAAKRPIITSDLPSIREILKNERDAILIPAGDSHALAAAVKNLENNPGLRHGLTENAFREVAEKYTWKIRAKKILEFMV